MSKRSSSSKRSTTSQEWLGSLCSCRTNWSLSQSPFRILSWRTAASVTCFITSLLKSPYLVTSWSPDSLVVNAYFGSLPALFVLRLRLRQLWPCPRLALMTFKHSFIAAYFSSGSGSGSNRSNKSSSWLPGPVMQGNLCSEFTWTDLMGWSYTWAYSHRCHTDRQAQYNTSCYSHIYIYIYIPIYHHVWLKHDMSVQQITNTQTCIYRKIWYMHIYIHIY